jgi:sulfur dioxygenase
MMIRQLFDYESFTFTYLLIDDATRTAALIDPVREQLQRDLGLIADLELSLKYVLETHVHADHVTSAGLIADATGAVTAASELGAACLKQRLRDGDVLDLGATSIEVIATPGHTRDSLSFRSGAHVFTGDALLVRGTGRTDFQSGDAGTLYDSITRRLFALPDDTRVWPGHDYRGQNLTTIGEEKRLNPRLVGKSRDDFIALMRELKLAPPRKIELAVPANLGCGRLPAT